jgi:TolB-like protein
MARFHLALWAVVLAALTMPANARADLAATRPTVTIAIFPFTVLGEVGHTWASRAMQEGLATGLEKAGPMRTTLMPAPPSPTADAARTAAENIGADYAIFGAIQFVDDQMRISGRILSVADGRTVAQLSCDGNLRDLFSIEDMLTARAWRFLAPAVVSSPPPSTTPPPPPFEMLGSFVPSHPPAYFDGSLASVLAKPDRYRDQYNQYYFNSWETSGYWGGYGGGWGWGGYFGGLWGASYGGPPLNPPSGAVGGW